MIRGATCAGTWYPKSKEEIEKYIDLKAEKVGAVACVSPHAGWMYSGKVAGEVYSRLTNYDTYVIIGPNHTGFGTQASIYSTGSWQMPLGKIDIDEETAKNILEVSEFLKSDTDAHSREHCLEVQLPFIQYFNPGAKIIPIVLMIDKFEICQDISYALSQAIKKSSIKILIIASTDMTHYETQQYAKQQDQ